MMQKIKSLSGLPPNASWMIPCVLALVTPVAGYFAAQWRCAEIDRAMRADLLDHAVSLARTINPERVKALAFNAADADTHAFQRLREQLTTWRTVVACRGIYTIARRDGQLVFGPESYASDDPQASPPGTIYEQPSQEMTCFFDDGVPFTEGSHTDEYGTFVSALAPVLSALTDKPVMAVGLDIEAADWNRTLQRQRSNVLLGSLALAAILLAGGLLLYRRERTSGEPHGLARHIETILTMTLGAALTVIAAWMLDDEEARARRRTFAHVTESRAAGIAALFADLRNNVLDATAGFHKASDHVDRREFHDFVTPKLRHAAVRALALIHMAPDADRAAFEARMRAEGFADYMIWRHDDAGNKAPAAAAENYYPIMYVEPMANNTNALGFDVMSEPRRRAAIERAVQSGLPSATEIITLAQEPMPVITVFQPVFTRAAPKKSAGLAALVIMPDELLRMISWLVPESRATAMLDLYALEAGRPPHFLAASTGSNAFPCPYIAAPRLIYGRHHGLCQVYPVLAFGKAYALAAHPGPAFLAAYPRRAGLTALWAGLLTTGMAVFLSAAIVRRRNWLTAQVNMRTMDLQASESRFRALYENAVSAIAEHELVMDADGRPSDYIFLHVNPAFERQTGLQAADVIGRRVTEAIPGIEREPFIEIYGKVVLTGEPVALERYSPPLRRYFNINAYRTAPGRFAAVFQDVTNRHRLQEQLEAAANTAKQLAREASAANIAKSRFLANMSHEIRTPMNGVLGMAELMLQTRLDEEQRRYTGIIHASGEALMSVINNILDFSKIDAGKMELVSMDFNLKHLCRELCDSLSAMAHAKKLRFNFHMAPDAPVLLRGDPHRLRQALVNLIGNAIKFTDAGGVSVQVFRVHGTDPAPLCFEVTDTGIGIPPDKQAHLFDPFFQVDDSMTRRHGGTGLGLCIAKELTAMMGGKIEVISPVAAPRDDAAGGPGTTFRLTAVFEHRTVAEEPAALSDADGKDQSNTGVIENKTGFVPELTRVSNADAPPTCASPAHILVAEDNFFNQQVLLDMLKKSGHTADVAGNGREALRMLSDTHYDLVFMDVQMPEMNGLEATRQIRNAKTKTPARGAPPISQIPIIGITAHAMPADRAACLDAGMNAYLSKPITPAQIIEVLSKWLPSGPIAGDERVIPATDGSSATDTPASKDDIAVFDKAFFVNNAMGNMIMAKQLADYFMANVPEELSALDAALASGDRDALTSKSHLIKGMCANLGAAAMRDAAGTIEQTARQGDFTAIPGMLFKLRQCFDKLQQALTAAFRRQQ